MSCPSRSRRSAFQQLQPDGASSRGARNGSADRGVRVVRGSGNLVAWSTSILCYGCNPALLWCSLRFHRPPPCRSVVYLTHQGAQPTDRALLSPIALLFL